MQTRVKFAVRSCKMEYSKAVVKDSRQYVFLRPLKHSFILTNMQFICDIRNYVSIIKTVSHWLFRYTKMFVLRNKRAYKYIPWAV